MHGMYTVVNQFNKILNVLKKKQECLERYVPLWPLHCSLFHKRWCFICSLHTETAYRGECLSSCVFICFISRTTEQNLIPFGIENLHLKLLVQFNFISYLSNKTCNAHETQTELHRFSQKLVIIQKI